MKNINLSKVIFENGANESTALVILAGVKKDISEREKLILADICTISENTDVPDRYKIYSFYNSKGEGFEAGKVPTGKYTCTYSITC